MSSKARPVMSSDHNFKYSSIAAIPASHASDDFLSARQELRLLALATYGLFLIATIYGRLHHGRFETSHNQDSRSIWRETWDNARGTIAFAFNHS